jgi:predicted CoA-binding protein
MTNPSPDELRDLYRSITTIATVGASSNPDKPANSVPGYLQRAGYRIVPVNPAGGEILGEQARTSLEDIDEQIDVVQVFRPPAEVPDIARAAARTGARVFWMQPGTESDEAASIAAGAGMIVVSGICMRRTHQELGLSG